MARRILVYGHGDKSFDGFPTAKHLETYICGGVFRDQGSRYHYSQMKRADTIVLSRDGRAFGHFEVDAQETPTDEDRKAYPPVKQTYLIGKSVLYGNKVRLADLGISRYQFGKYITAEQLDTILNLAGEMKEFRP